MNSRDRFPDMPDDPEADVMFCGPAVGAVYARNIERRERAKRLSKQAMTMWAPVRHNLIQQGMTRMEATMQIKAEHPEAHDAMFPWSHLHELYREELLEAQTIDQTEYEGEFASSPRDAFERFVHRKVSA